MASSSSAAISSGSPHPSGTSPIFSAVASISRHLMRTASVMPPEGNEVCDEDVEPFFSLSLDELDELDLSLPEIDDDDLAALVDFEALLLLEEPSLAELLFGVVGAGLARKRFQFLISVLARAITSSSLLLLRSSFTVMPMRVLVRMSRLMLSVCRAFSRSRA